MLLSELLLLQGEEGSLGLDQAEAWLWCIGLVVFVVLREHRRTLYHHVLGIGLLLKLGDSTGGVTMHLIWVSTLSHLLLLLLLLR